ncbi:ATP-binding protein [Lederbergia sp. NSJ-179]|uniref:sensor histidine kinase n=1 Tax=Lederbergia sp. NSJ-179 TaxID=2931402 RepID=UPI001FD44EA2|nr:ATP-binding protein [Lederbergia sp. NSJ-179]MCJ7841741.1 ATP-binding protein [Lederbergia sp. NSJ-179]
MEKFSKTNVIGLLPILIIIGLAAYFTSIVVKFPLIGMKVTEEQNQWIVKKVYDKGWAANHPIEKGDIVKLVNGKKTEQHLTVILFNRVEMADSITILDKNSNTNSFSISYSDLDTQYVIYLLSPFLLTMTTLVLSVFLYQKKKGDKSAIILIYFLMAIGVSYLSASASARGDVVGRVVNTITFPGSVILFVHFIRSYLWRSGLIFIKSRSLIVLYLLNVIVLLIMASNLLFYKWDFHSEIIEIIIFLLLISYLLFLLIRVYLKYNNSEVKSVLKILLFTIFLAFSPFIFLSVLPDLFFRKEIISTEITALFLIFIPISFAYLQLAERLFDIEFVLNRLQYYTLLALPFAVINVLILSIGIHFPVVSHQAFITFLLLFICAILFLFAKESLDYKFRYHLFSPKYNFETSLYAFFQRAKYESKVSSLLRLLENEIKHVLMVKQVVAVELFTENNGNNWKVKNGNPSVGCSFLEKIDWSHQRIGSLLEGKDGFGIVVEESSEHKTLILSTMKKSKTKLNIQEKIWLETLAYFSSVLLENFLVIEELFEEIENYKDDKKFPTWFSRLMFSISEKERATLSIDLHDSVLQDQLQFLRDIETISGKIVNSPVKKDLFYLKEKVLDNIHLIRETCNELRPPFLHELGIVQSVQNLIEQTKLRCDFILDTDLDPQIKWLDQNSELALYRVVQELLNNAMKHSEASKVVISLQHHKESISLIYSDDGIGLDVEKLNDSFKTMGIIGMKERIKSLGGTMTIQSTLGKGTKISIEIGREQNDTCVNSR